MAILYAMCSGAFLLQWRGKITSGWGVALFNVRPADDEEKLL